MMTSTDTAMREGSRDGRPGCLVCGDDVPSSRARYCTRACQQRSYRLRHHTPAADLTSARKTLQRRKALVAQTVYECGGCLRFVSSKSVSAMALKDEELEREVPL